MFKGQNGKTLRWYQPRVRGFSTILSLLLLIAEIALTSFEYVEARHSGNPISVILAGMFTFHIIFTLFYVIGIFRLIDCYMVPWLTLQLIFMTTFGLFVIVWWIATVLSLFGLVNYNALDYKASGLSSGEFFVLTGVGLTLFLAVVAKFSMIMYKGFTVVREFNTQSDIDIPEARCFTATSIPALKPSYV